MLERVLDVLERVAEDEVAARLQVLRLPVVFPLFALVEIGIEPEIHRAHVERAHFGLRQQRRREPLLHRHVVAAAGRDVDDRVGPGLDLRQELHEDFRIGRGPSVFRIARVQMQDRRTRFGRADRARRDLVRRDREIGRHGRRVYRSRHGAGDDHFAGVSHDLFLIFVVIDLHRFEEARDQVVRGDRRGELGQLARIEMRSQRIEHVVGHVDLFRHRVGVCKHRPVGSHRRLSISATPEAHRSVADSCLP